MKEVTIKIIKVFIVIYLIAIFIIAIDWLTISKNDLKTKYAIVYWSKVEQNWEVSERLKARLYKSIELFNSKKIDKIIVSGWKWVSWFNEAEVMRKYLMKNKIKYSRIIIDKNWNTTMNTSKNAYKIIKINWDYPNIWVVWVSQFFNCSRVKLSLKKVGFSNVGCISPEYYELRDIYSLIREFPAYIKYFFMWVWKEININKSDIKKIWNKISKKVLEEINK